MRGVEETPAPESSSDHGRERCSLCDFWLLQALASSGVEFI